MLSGTRRMAYKTVAGKCKVVIVHERTRGKEICSDLHHVRKALSSFRSIMEWKLISLSSSFNSVVALDEKYNEIPFSSYFTYLGTSNVDFHV